MKNRDVERFVRLLERLKWSNLRVAEYLGVSERSVYRWKNGTHRIPQTVFVALELTLRSEV